LFDPMMVYGAPEGPVGSCIVVLPTADSFVPEAYRI
jgi:hypothetical protein